jgi:hypothetical protein
MDYLEGFLIGSIWSDTDYRTRRHYHAHVFLAALMGAAFTFFLFFPDKMSKWVVVPQPLSLVFLIFLMLAPPIISSIYYRVPFYVRPFLLLLYIMKYVLLFYTLVHFFFPLVTVDRANFSDLLFARIDDRMTRSLDRFSDSGKVLTTVAGVLIGAFWIIAEGLLVVLILIAVPLAAICLLKGIRYVLDIVLYELIDRYVLKDGPARTDEVPWLGSVVDDDDEEEGSTGSTPILFPGSGGRQKETDVTKKRQDVAYDGGMINRFRLILKNRLRSFRRGLRNISLRGKKWKNRVPVKRGVRTKTED